MRKVKKARVPKQQRGIETREKLIDAAKILFVEKGYYKTHGPEIAACAGLATGTFYSYFNDKKEVLTELIRRFYSDSIGRALAMLQETPFPSGDNRKMIRGLISTLYAVHEEQQDLHRAIYPLMFMDRDITELSREEDRKVISLIAGFYSNDALPVTVTDVTAAAELTLRLCDEIIHRLLFWGTETDTERLLAELEEMLFRYLFSPVP